MRTSDMVHVVVEAIEYSVDNDEIDDNPIHRLGVESEKFHIYTTAGEIFEVTIRKVETSNDN